MALAKGAALAGARIIEGVPGDRHPAAEAAASPACAPRTATSRRSTSSTAPACGRASSARRPASPSPTRRPSTTTSSPRGSRICRRDCPCSRTRRPTATSARRAGGLLVGLFEPVCAPWNVGGIPSDFSFGEIEPDWDRMGPYLEKAMARVPVTLEAGIKKFFCGPESFTPDLRPIVGEAPELRNYFVAAGLNSIGILTGGGIGRLLAHWIVNGTPDMDVTGLQHRPPAPLPGQSRIPARAHHRVAGHRLQVPLPHHDAADRPRREAVRGARPAGRGGRLFPRRQRLGGRRLVRARRGTSRRSRGFPGAGRTGSRGGRRSTAPRARA